jgi:hypothetical protein
MNLSKGLEVEGDENRRPPTKAAEGRDQEGAGNFHFPTTGYWSCFKGSDSNH